MSEGELILDQILWAQAHSERRTNESRENDREMGPSAGERADFYLWATVSCVSMLCVGSFSDAFCVYYRQSVLLMELAYSPRGHWRSAICMRMVRCSITAVYPSHMTVNRSTSVVASCPQCPSRSWFFWNVLFLSGVEPMRISVQYPPIPHPVFNYCLAFIFSVSGRERGKVRGFGRGIQTDKGTDGVRQSMGEEELSYRNSVLIVRPVMPSPHTPTVLEKE